ncbi:MAG: FAD binding domain-containing protein [Thermoleophilia bacterium]|nr:FAD binding domain-containing protein [Thermoleophilia bacterium]
MDDLVYTRATSIDEALSLLDRHGSKAQLLAGGTDVVVGLREGRLAARVLVGIEALEGLREIRVDGGDLEIGAGVTFTTLAGDPLVRELAPALAEAASLVGSPQVRNRGTLGGNLGTASPAGDTFAPLLAHEARVSLLSRDSRRTLSIDKYLTYRQATCVERQNLIDRVLVPIPREAAFRSVFVRLGRRNALAVSRMNLALLVAFEAERPVRARMVLGAVGLVPVLVDGAEKEILTERGNELVRGTVGCAAAAVAGSLGDRPSAPYKTRAVESLVREGLRRCGLID